MSPIAIDTEGPKFDKVEKWKGNCYGDPRGLVCWSIADGYTSNAYQWDSVFTTQLQAILKERDVVVFFHGKHDIGWLRKMGVSFDNVVVWDCQLAEFILSHQTLKFPSLDYSCEKYGIPKKLDIVKLEYWDKGIDTCDIPWSVLQPYAAHDAEITLAVYYAQLKVMTAAQIKLCKLMSADMLVLQEMEQNGLIYDEQLCLERSQALEEETTILKQKLSNFYPNIPINFNSGDDLSAFLYGGTIVEAIKVHDGFYKSGAKKGLPKMKNDTVEHVLPRLFEPVKGSELKKEGYFETNEGVLKKLKGKNKHIVELLLQLAKHEKINGTYYKGLPKLNEEMHWPAGRLHGQLNQTLAVSGRLSSSKPNQQNFASEIQDIFISEYP